jgi:hypothetical protein
MEATLKILAHFSLLSLRMAEAVPSPSGPLGSTMFSLRTVSISSLALGLYGAFIPPKVI